MTSPSQEPGQPEHSPPGRGAFAQDPGELDRSWRQPLLRFAYSYLHDAQAAEDVAQEVLAQACQGPAPDQPRAWLYTLVRNRCLNLLRGLGRRPDAERLASDPNLAASLTGPLTRLANAEAAADAMRLLNSLGEAQREVLILRYTEDLSREEIARVLDLPVSVVKSRLYEGMRRLRELA